MVWSKISKIIIQSSLTKTSVNNQNLLSKVNTDIIFKQVRNSGGHGPKTFVIRPSDWQWDKFKDLIHFYIMAGAIPITGILIYTNIFIGPATLATIPEGYEPKHWEYYKHPITRFLARYIVRQPQQEYEKMCFELYEESEKMLLRQLEKDVKKKMSERQDYQAWYYRPAMVKFARGSKKFFEEHPQIIGS